MNKYIAGFIGAGNMGGALARAVVKTVCANDIIVSCKNIENAKTLADSMSCNYGTNTDVAKNSKFVFLGVKPNLIKDIAMEIKDVLLKNKDCIIVSMAAGISIGFLESLFEGKKIIRIMPNTPCEVGMGMTLATKNSLVTEDEMKEFKKIMSQSGKLDEIPEDMIDASCAVAGCGPAFVYMFIEAMADGGAKCGLPKEKALEYVLQTVAGSAKMVEATGKHPQVLRDQVCSPGGSTIEGVYVLQDGKMQETVKNAVEASYNKTKKLAE